MQNAHEMQSISRVEGEIFNCEFCGNAFLLERILLALRSSKWPSCHATVSEGGLVGILFSCFFYITRYCMF